MQTKVYIDPRSTIAYSSFYIKGLYDYLGKKNVSFSSKYFKELEDIDMLMAFVEVTDTHPPKRYIIDYRDQNDLIQGAYDWCDVYAKINVNNVDGGYIDNHKIVSIPPGFGIRIWSFGETMYHLTRNFFDAKIYKNSRALNIHIQPKLWARRYWRQFKRQPISYYTIPGIDAPDGNYVFFVSTYWLEAQGTNRIRNQYVLACFENENIDFEGGFFVHKNIDKSTIDLPKDLVYHTYLSNREYMNKIKKSIFVFNTPAVHKCHGWKLGEFLAMGKAIITTPLYNELPFPLEHGKEVFIVEDEAGIKDAVRQLLEDKELRKTLQSNAKRYYDQYASPERVISCIMDKLKNR